MHTAHLYKRTSQQNILARQMTSYSTDYAGVKLELNALVTEAKATGKRKLDRAIIYGTNR